MAQSENDSSGKLAPSVWILTDGKAGDAVQCLAIASALSRNFENRVVAPRAPWSWLAPRGPIDPRDNMALLESPINGAPPDLVIASGRRAIPYARAVKAAGAACTKLVILKDPRMSRGVADFIWAPTHDRLSGDNVFSTLTSPHDVLAKINKVKSAPAKAIGDLPRPLLGVLLGGPSRGARYGMDEAHTLAVHLKSATKNFASIAVTPSRRTPQPFLQQLRDSISADKLFVWNGKEENPYHDILACADALIVAADSHNMMSEALATGAGIYAYQPPGMAKKLVWLVNQLEETGAVRRFEGEMVPFTSKPVDATPVIVAEIKKRLAL